MHSHNHNAGKFTAEQETVALIKYMCEHNASHTNELEDIANKLDKTKDGDAYSLIKAAIDKYNEGNTLLADALAKTEGQYVLINSI